MPILEIAPPDPAAEARQRKQAELAAYTGALWLKRFHRIWEAAATLLGPPFASFERFQEAYKGGQICEMEVHSAWWSATQKGRSAGCDMDRARGRYGCRYKRPELVAAFAWGRRVQAASIARDMEDDWEGRADA